MDPSMTNMAGYPLMRPLSAIYPPYYDPNMLPYQQVPQQMPQQIPSRPESYIQPSQNLQGYPPMPVQPVQPIQPRKPDPPGLNIHFVPVCRYEDTQAIRTVAFHPSGKYFAVGTNSKQMIVFKYPNTRNLE